MSLEELVKEFSEKKELGMMMSCQVNVAESLLRCVDLSVSKRELLLENLKETCNCRMHLDKTLDDKYLAAVRKNAENPQQKRKKEGPFVSFIKSASLSPRMRYIL